MHKSLDEIFQMVIEEIKEAEGNIDLICGILQDELIKNVLDLPKESLSRETHAFFEEWQKTLDQIECKVDQMIDNMLGINIAEITDEEIIKKYLSECNEVYEEIKKMRSWLSENMPANIPNEISDAIQNVMQAIIAEAENELAEIKMQIETPSNDDDTQEPL